jgi:two-component system, sensor histidine kinase and response regulator
MDGFEVCRQLKLSEELREIPVIFISALSNINDIVQAFEIGGVDYISKPFQFPEVIARLKNHLMLQDQKRQILEQNAQIEAIHKRDKQRFQQIGLLREQFVQSAAHGLKNPLTIIKGSADIISRFDEVRANQHLREYVATIVDSSDKMSDLVTSMLDFLRLQSSIELNLQPVNFKRFVESLVDKHHALAQNRHIELNFSASVNSDDMYLTIDEKLMSRAIDNLLLNAINYSTDKTKVTVTLSEEPQNISLNIKDEGFGIHQDDMGKLFTPFFRARKESAGRQIDGAGLGLVVVKEILEQHRGHIELESELGKGTSVQLTLPKQTSAIHSD